MTNESMTNVALTREDAERITQSLDLVAEAGQADLAFVFGTRHLEPAYIAADLYGRGAVNHVTLTGGDNRITDKPEAHAHLEVLLDEGVPGECIIVEDRCTNTLENVVFALPKIATQVGLESIRAIVVVTKWYHCRRAMMTLKRYFPAGIRYFAKTYEPDGYGRADWHLNQEATRRVLKEWCSIPDYLERGDIAPIQQEGNAFG